MKVLFVHQNFPGQYLHLARFLAQSSTNQLVAITQRKDVSLPGVQTIIYTPKRRVTPTLHHYLADTEAAILNGQEVARVALQLRDSGFVPDVMIGHNGWGEIWYLKEVYPAVPLLGYFEFFYRLNGADIGFDPASPPAFDDGPRIRSKNIGNLLGLDAVDWGQCPTQWQRSLYPKHYQAILHVAHEGVDTDVVVPDPNASITLNNAQIELKAGDEVITYVARNLETYRGFQSFMRALPRVLDKRPNAHAIIVGGDDISYGPRLPKGQTFKELMLAEVGSSLDMQRVHFLGKVPYSSFLKVLQVSRVHIYLTYPFVLSWSMLEAMSAGCLVVGSRTPPVEEVVRDGENGWLVDFFSPDQIADRAIEALADGGAHVGMRARARRTVMEQYDLRSVCLPAQLLMVNRIVGRAGAR
jgi:glycosyltransferase involved in cell wall biosynthesis